MGAETSRLSRAEAATPVSGEDFDDVSSLLISSSCLRLHSNDTTLHELDLSGKPISHQSSRRLGAALAAASALRKLRLRGCCIGPEDCAGLCKLMGNHINELDISENGQNVFR